MCVSRTGMSIQPPIRASARARFPSGPTVVRAAAGRADVLPHATEAVWTLADHRSVYVVQHADGAANSAVTILLEDLDAHVAAIAARGLEPDERETYSNGVLSVEPLWFPWMRMGSARIPVEIGGGVKGSAQQ